MRGIIFLVAALAAITGTYRVVWADGDITIVAFCDGGSVVGSVHGVPGPYPRGFAVEVKDHVPGDPEWRPIPGAAHEISATASSVKFGPLEISAARAGANSVRVEQSLSPAKSESFAPCGRLLPTPYPESTVTPTVTPAPTQTPTPSPVASSIGPVPPSVTPTPIPIPPIPMAFPPTGGEPPSEKTDGNEWLIPGILGTLIVGLGLFFEAKRRRLF